jgi:hypothetical protein
MKLFNCLLFLIAGCFTSCQAFHRDSKSSGFVVIELYTSEGCSSCPYADDIVAKIQQQYADKRVYALSFHVDYWDRLGWKDPFSNGVYSFRQEQYDKILKSTVFTPQVVLNGIVEMPGYRQSDMIHFINENIAKEKPSTISLQANQVDSNKITVHFLVKNFTQHNSLQLILIQHSATNHIKAGENNGRTLHNINIVRQMLTLSQASGEAQLTLPSGLTGRDVSVIALLQEPSMAIIDANKCEVKE